MDPSELRLDKYRRLSIELCESRYVLTHPIAEIPAMELSTAMVEAQVDSIESPARQLAQNTFGLTGNGQTVVIIDSGIAYDHSALGGGFGPQYRVVGGWDFTEENDADPYDDAPAGLHGTHVAGIIGSNDEQHPGLATDVDFVALRVFNDQGKGDFEWIEEALQWVETNIDTFEHPITTVNLSLGTKWKGDDVPQWAILEDELLALREAGLFITVAAGNNFEKEPTTGLSYPAASPHVIPVASHDANGLVSEFSRRSERVLVAPGEDITSTSPDYLYDFNGITDDFLATSGTSMAAPYIAGASVLIREAIEISGQDAVGPAEIYNILASTATSVFDPVTNAHYHRVDLQAALTSVLPVELQTRLQQSVTDLGSVEQLEASTAADRLYGITATHSGTLTLEIHPDLISTGRILVYDTNRVELPESRILRRGNRLDLEVTAGEQIIFEIASSSASTRIRLTNLIQQTEEAIHIFGSEGDDDIRLKLNTGKLLINGVSYSVAGLPSQITIDGSSGTDAFRLWLTPDQENVSLTPDQVRAVADEYQLTSHGFESNYVYAIGQGDETILEGSSGKDRLTSLPHYSLISGPGYSNYVQGFASVIADGNQGGEDEARLYGSHGDDQFTGQPHEGTLISNGSRTTVQNFDRVRIQGRGGIDRATLHDSADNNHFFGLSEYSLLRGKDFEQYLADFEDVRVYSTAGGSDVARLYDSASDDTFVGLSDYSLIESKTHRIYANGFDKVRAVSSQGGTDTARLIDSPTSDEFFGLPTYAVMRGSGFDNYVEGFAKVKAHAFRGGQDRARLYGSPGNDVFYALPEYSLMFGATYSNYAAGFEVVQGFGHQGGYDEARLFDSADNDVLSLSSHQGTMSGAGYTTSATGFNTLFVQAQRGGDDRAMIHRRSADVLFSNPSLRDFMAIAYQSDSSETRSLTNALRARENEQRRASLRSAIQSDNAIDIDTLFNSLDPDDHVIVSFGFDRFEDLSFVRNETV